MSLTVAIIVIVVLAVALLVVLAVSMDRARRLRPHRAAGGRPPARMRWFSRRRDGV